MNERTDCILWDGSHSNSVDSRKVLAKRFGISESQVSRIISRQRWKKKR